MSTEPILVAHRSIRAFLAEPLPVGLFERLITEAQRAPTDATAQMYSFVRVEDAALRARIAALSGGQEHVRAAAEFLIVCADVHRLARVLERNGHTLGAFPATGLHFATVDATLAAQRLIDAAEAVDLGTVCIGGILNGVAELVELLALPRGVLPLFGLCLGWPAEEPVRRPRVALGAVLHRDRYREQTADEAAADVAAMSAITRSGDWPSVLTRYFAVGGTMEEREPALRLVLERQGFTWE